MSGLDPAGSDTVVPNECCAWPDGCHGSVHWQTDGAKRCSQHQRLYERARRKSRLVSLTVAVVVIVTVGVVVNALIRPEEGPSQARAWGICHEHATENLDL